MSVAGAIQPPVLPRSATTVSVAPYPQSNAFNVPQIGGVWIINGNQGTSIQQQGSVLTFVNERGQTSPGYFLNSTQVIASAWGPSTVPGTKGLLGTIVPTADGQRILWANGTVWDQLNLAGQGVIGTGGHDVFISDQNGYYFTLTNEVGQSTLGYITDTNHVYAAANRYWNALSGTLAATNEGYRIAWSNGSHWDFLHLGGEYFINNYQSTEIYQNGDSLTFVNERGGVSAGYISSYGQVVATGWANLVGNLQSTTAGLRVAWTNGTAWDQPRLAGTWVINSRPTQVYQGVDYPGGDGLTFINENGQVSSGNFADSYQVVARNWGNLYGTILTTSTGREIYWSNGTIWTQSLSSRGLL